MPKKKALALVPASARMPAISKVQKAIDVPKAIRDDIKAFEDLIGGRQALIEALSTADSSEDVRAVLDVIADPKYDETSLALLCAQAGISPGQLFSAFQSAALFRGQVLGSLEATKVAPAVVRHVASVSVPHKAVCRPCNGLGQIHSIKRDKKGNEERVSDACEACNGVGEVQCDPDFDQQSRILEMVGLIQKGSGLAVNVNQQTIVPPQTSQGGSLEQLQQAVSELIYSRPADPVKDAELVKP